MFTVPVVHQIQRYKEVAVTVAAEKPRVTGGIEVRYWRGVDRMAIRRLVGHGTQFHDTMQIVTNDLFVLVYIKVREGCVTSADPFSFALRHHLHGRVRLPSRRFAQAQGCRGRRYRQKVCLSYWSPLPQMSQIFRKKKSKSKSKLDDAKERDRERVKELLLSEDVGSAPGSASGSNRASPSLSNGNDGKTDAERRFEEAQRRRVSFRLVFHLIC